LALLTADALLVRASRRLAEAGVRDPGLDAERLLRHVLGWDRGTLVIRGHELLPDDAAGRFESLVAARARRRPLQHLTGVQAFWKHDFEVSPDVLIPRPETELLVETALARLSGVAAPLVVDVGTGSGCIAVSLAAERADAEVHATDLSAAALVVARRNAARAGVAVRFHQGDLLAPVAALQGRVHLVACNPPYVGEVDEATLAPEVRDHEPRLALFPPEGRQALYARLARESAVALRAGGALVVEVGFGMADEVAARLAATGLVDVESRPDLAGIPRVVSARRP
jgi:release factor glutamine methyltransferase